MKLPINHTIRMTRDTTETISFSAVTPSSITGVYFTVKKSIDQAENTFQKTIGNGVTQTENGYVIKISPTDTASLPEGEYVYDLKIVYGSDKKQLLRGPFELDRGVTENA